MIADIHHFNIGEFQCTVVNDGTFNYPNPAQLFFANAPQEELTQALQNYNIDPANWDAYTSPYPSMLIEHAGRRILVDMGSGPIAPTTGKLSANLQRMGIAAETIDTIFITHAHLDHIGGALDKNGQLVFPNARFLMGQAEWDFWATDPDLMNLQIPDQLRQAIRTGARDTLPRLRERMDLVEPGAEIVPGIEVIDASGHTPGQLVLSIASKGDRLLTLGDVFFHPAHIEHPQWYSRLDYDPEQTVATRRRIFAQAAADGALITAGHLPWPCLGTIKEDAAGWQWQAIQPGQEIDI